MSEERIKCPYCSELILEEAIKCRFCGEWFTEKNKPDINSELRISGPSEEVQDIQSEPELEEAVREPQKEPVESPIEKPVERPVGRRVPPLPPQKHRIAWLRIILAIVYIGVIIAFVIYERNAHEELNRGRESEKLQKYREAREIYREVVEEYQLSFAVIEARKNLRRVEDQLGNDFSIDDVYWLPFVTWPVCSVLLFLVFVTRILRPGMVFLAFLLLLLGIFGSVLQLSWYGLIPIEPIAVIVEEFAAEPKGIFVTSYIMLIITAMMTLTATKKLPFGHHCMAAKAKRY
ncbi:MAG: hypothetical protein GY845_06465 [Planctomycetes bacterium]|nr:hypothetical protein [Planctomycetota bacterium]